MTPRDTKKSSATLPSTSRVKPSPFNDERSLRFLNSCKRVLNIVRGTKIKERVCSVQFERLPSSEVLPMYRKTIIDPVALHDLDMELTHGKIASPERFVERFTLMIKNALVFNRAHSTIAKDAKRLYRTFKHAMKEEFGVSVPDMEDEDEEEAAWTRDLRQRPTLAFYEREQFREVQDQVNRDKAFHKKNTKTVVDKERQRFVDESLKIVLAKDDWISIKCPTGPGKRDVAREEVIEHHQNFKRPARGDAEDAEHDVDACGLCFSSAESDEAKLRAQTAAAAAAARACVVTPKYHVIPSVRYLDPNRLSPSVSKKRSLVNEFELEITSDVEMLPKRFCEKLTGPKRHHLLRGDGGGISFMATFAR